jgi:hypothetical protein
LSGAKESGALMRFATQKYMQASGTVLKGKYRSLYVSLFSFVVIVLPLLVNADNPYSFHLAVHKNPSSFSSQLKASNQSTGHANPPGGHTLTNISLADNTSVLTAKNDNWRTGQNASESQLTTNDVNTGQFGQLARYPVDGQIYAQPLFMANLAMGEKNIHDVVFVVTEHDSVYAFDADQSGATPPLWHTSFIDPAHGITPFAKSDISGCTDIGAEVGITGTPVIDGATDTLYVVALTKEQGQYMQRLHALNIITGQERSGSPVTIQASVPGVGDGTVGGNVSFDPQTADQRPALLLLNGVVYIAWSSFCDSGYYHGWILGYNSSTLQQVAVYNDTPNGYQGGIWESGSGLSADTDGNLYVSTGNGTYNLNSGTQDAGDTILKLSTQQGLQVSDYFTPFNQQCFEPADTDLGSAGVLLLPTSPELVTSSKEGRIYVVNRDNMGKYTEIDDPCDNQKRADVDAITQEMPPGTINGGLYGAPTYWDSGQGETIYMGGAVDHVRAFAVNAGKLSQISQTRESFTYPGANSAISCNGTLAGTGILWVVDANAILRAYDAHDLTKELYNSNQDASRDALPDFIKFSVPTVVHGKVFVGTQGSLVMYGLLNLQASNKMSNVNG